MKKIYELNVGDKFNFKGIEFILVKLNKVNAKIKKTAELAGPSYNLNVNAIVEPTTSAKEAGYGDYAKATTSIVPFAELKAGTLVRLNSSAVKSAKFSTQTNYVILKVNSMKYSMTEVNGTGVNIVSAPFNSVHKINLNQL